MTALFASHEIESKDCSIEQRRIILLKKCTRKKCIIGDFMKAEGIE